MSDETRRLILARRARFVAATLAGAALSAPTDARADSGIDAAAADADSDAGDAGDGGDGGDTPIFVEAGVRDVFPEPCLCVMAPKATDSDVAAVPAAFVAAAAIVAARRRKRSRSP
jgi:hypothetical protein